VARGTRIQPGWNGSQTTTDRGAPNNSSAVTIKYTPPVARQGALKALVANVQIDCQDSRKTRRQGSLE